MSCPSEPTWLLYADGEADPSNVRELESHLVTCRDCRRTVVALQGETTLFGDVLHERERRVRIGVPAPAPLPEPAVAIGLPLAIAAVTAALAAIGFLLESRIPGGLDHLNPLRLKGAYEMAFDLIFLARDRVPGLIELALSVGAMASVSAVLTLGVGALYRRVYGAAAVLLLAALVTPQAPARALEVRVDEDTSIAADEVIRESMLLSGDRVHIDGVVEGDVWVGAERVTIGGTIKGNVYALCRDLELTGTIEGSLHGAIEDVLLDGNVNGSVYVAAETLTLAAEGAIGRDLSLIAEEGILGGRVGRDVLFGGEELEIRSEVGRNLDVRWADEVALRDRARIGENLDARLRSDDDLDQAPGARVGGVVTIHPREGMKQHYLDAYRDASFYAFHGLALVAGFLFGLLLHWVAPRLMESDLSTSPQFFRSLLYGFLVLVGTPVAIVVLGLTVVGLPLAVLSAFVFVVILYSAELVVGAWIGRLLLPPREEGMFAWGRSFFIGLAILTVATHVPFLGPPIMIVATLIGTGLFFQAAREMAELRA